MFAKLSATKLASPGLPSVKLKPRFVFILVLVGCVLAVLMAKRRNVFGPMVQPPLVLVVVMPLLVLITGSGAAAGAGARTR